MTGNSATAYWGWRIVLALVIWLAPSACTSTPSSFEGPDYSDDTRKLEKELMAEAAALGAVQGAAGIAASFDKTGLSSLVTMPAGRAARDAMLIRADKRMREQVERDNAEFYKRYGITDADAGPVVMQRAPERGGKGCVRRAGIRRC